MPDGCLGLMLAFSSTQKRMWLRGGPSLPAKGLRFSSQESQGAAVTKDVSLTKKLRQTVYAPILKLSIENFLFQFGSNGKLNMDRASP